MTLTQRYPFRSLRRLAAAALFVAVSAPAFAITFGTADGTGHPEVGSIVVKIPDQGVFQWCSGTLIDTQVFLTASHCTAPIAQYLADHPDWQFLVTFDPVIDTTGTTGTFYTGTPHTNPLYGAGGQNDPHDIAVITLDSAPTSITPASLPTAGLFDATKADGSLNGTRFTAVGYGSTRDSMKKGPQGIDSSNVERQTVDQGFRFLTEAWLTFDMLPTGSNDSGGTCYGDSGGPHFLHVNGAETNIVAAITITGDAQCKSSDKDYRTDSPSARAFLGQFVTLP